MRYSPLKCRMAAGLPAFSIFTLCIAGANPHLRAQSPFQFREAYLLEQRMAPDRGGFIDISHFDENMGFVKPTYVQNGDCMNRTCKGPDGREVLDLYNPMYYQNGMWLTLLEHTDKSRGEGAFAVAGPMYQEMITQLGKAQGDNSSSVALMCDHLGEYYLEGRDFEKAYQTIEHAVALRRAMLQALGPEPADGTSEPNAQKRLEIAMHLADMQTRLGQMDLGKGDLVQAQARLSEAVAIENRASTVRFVGSLFAVYFDSLLLEKQGKWQEAEGLWKQSIALREPLQQANPYWDCLREMAAFYARKGDFHPAAQIAAKVDEGKGKQLSPSIRMPYLLDSRPRRELETGAYTVYRQESDTALKEIMAVDKWRTDGSAAGAALLPAPYQTTNRPLFDHGSDSELAQLLSWIEQRVFLHMSVLLDGQPNQQQVETAYQLLCDSKGRYLDSIAAATGYAEAGRNNPGIDTDTLPIMDEIGQVREYQAQLYLEAALDGSPFPAARFGAAENVQRILSKSLSADPSISSLTGNVTVKSLVQAVPPDAAFLDFVLWNRMDRDSKTPTHREYGVFVLRHGQAVRYVRLGAADAIEQNIDALKSGVLGGHTRGFLVESRMPALSQEAVNQRLKVLYAGIIAPIESDLGGATQLLIVPDGKLTLAPLCALINGQGHALLESYTVSYLTSWREIASSVHIGSEGSGTSIIVGNPDYNLVIGDQVHTTGQSRRYAFVALPGAEMEARDVQRALDLSGDRVLIGKSARKWLIQSVQSPQILHLATHTIPSIEYVPPVVAYNLFDFPQAQTSQNPLIQSAIALAGANHAQSGPEDGILTGLEVTRLHLTGTSLVVLSTCESGQGTAIEGLGVLGLRAAFSMAGAESLVMTLWPVNDQAGRQFMQFFYSHLAKGPAAALRQAQLDMISKTQYTNPFYWAGYLASGAPKVSAKPSVRASNTVAPAAQETLLTPRCFEVFMSAHQGSETSYRTLRLKLGGVVYRTQNSPEQTTYDLNGPGNTIVARTSSTMNGGPRYQPETRGDGRERWTGTISIQNRKDLSSFTLRFGRPSTESEKRELLTFQGGPKLFPTLDIPESFPGPAAYASVSDSYATALKLDKVAPCAAIPSW